MMREASTMDRPVEKAGFWSRRNLLLGALLLALLIVAVVLYPSLRRWAQAEISVDVSRVRIATVTRGDLVRDVSVQGNVVAAFHPTLFSPARGIVRVTIKAGEVVAEGQELARVRSPELESLLLQERSSLISLQADLERSRIGARQTRLRNEQGVHLRRVELEAAERAMDRAERTREEGILNAVEYERAQDELRLAGLRLELAEQEAGFEDESLEFEIQNRRSLADRQRLLVEDLERQVGELVLRAPVSGLVSRVEVTDHDAVGQGDPVLTVVDLSAFEVEAAFPENYADEILSGTEAVVTYEGKRYPAVVKSISPEVEGSRVKAFVAFAGDTPEGIKQNQRVQVRAIFERRPDVVKVQRGPFLEAGAGRLAYVVEDGVAVLRPIEVGAISVSEIEIAGGLEVGDQIIISDPERFKGAERVLLRD